jgi:hypothetical protein
VQSHESSPTATQAVATIAPPRPGGAGAPVTSAGPPARPERGRAVGDRWPLIVLLAALAAIALNAAQGAFDSDAWWHLRSGDLILDRGEIPSEDPFAWTAAGRPWRLNSWLFDVLVAGTRRLGGTTPVIALTLLAVVGFGCACYLLARRAGARPWPSVAVASVSTTLLTEGVAERPHMLSYLLFAATLVLCAAALRGSNRALAALAALFVVWSNLHLAFTAGIAAVVVFAGASAVRERRLARPLIVAGSAAVAGLCNPVGLSAYTAAFETRTTATIIKEWLPVSLARPRDVALVVIMLVAFASLWRTGRWRRLDGLLLVAMFSALTLDAVRNAPFLLIVASPEIALGLSTLAMPRLRAVIRPRAAPLVHGIAIGLFVVVALWAQVLADPRPTSSETYPVRTTQAIPAGCRLLNEDAFGGYITDKRWPEVLVSQDGRNGSEEDLEKQRLVVAGRPGAMKWIDRHGVDCVLVKPDRPLVATLRATGWRQVASEPSAVLLLRP